MIATVVLLPSALNANPNFIHFAQAFQSWPAVLFLIAAYVLALHRVAGNAPLSRSRRLYVRNYHCRTRSHGNGCFSLASIPGYIARVSPAAAGELSAMQTKIPA